MGVCKSRQACGRPAKNEWNKRKGHGMLGEKEMRRTTLPRIDRNNFASNASRGPKSFRALRIAAAPSAWPENFRFEGPKNNWQINRIITAESVLDDCAWTLSSRYTLSVRRARECLDSASTEGPRLHEKLECAVVRVSTARSSASLVPSRRGISSSHKPNDHQRL